MDFGKLVSVKTLGSEGGFDGKHTPYSAEIRLFSCIQQGDIESLIAQLKNYDSVIVMGKMSDDELMQYKYMAVSTVTLATRYAIQGGLNESKAYEFSDRVIKTVDGLKDKQEILVYTATEMIRLTEDVKKSKKEPEYSPHIRSAVKYINERLSEKIRVSDVAGYCSVSADYLSQIFKRETGENLSSYIVRRKLEGAKLLLLEGMSSKQVCMRMGFSSQAYFVTSFKRYCKMTPTDYIKLANTNK